MNNNVNTRKLTLDAMGVRLAQAARELPPESRAQMFVVLLEDLMKPVGALGRSAK